MPQRASWGTTFRAHSSRPWFLSLLGLTSVSLGLLSCSPALSQDRSSQIALASGRTDVDELPRANLKGWDYLYRILVQSGLSAKRAEALLSDRRMPEREPVFFRVKPRESHVLYRKHNTAKTRAMAKEFYIRNERWIHIAEARFGVPGEVLSSLLQVETAGGRHMGDERVFYRLARLAAVAEPQNIERNIVEQARKGDISDPVLVRERGNVLEGMFLPQVISTIALADQMGIHPLELRGSSGGAIGIPQFLPGNVFRYGVDADSDGKVDVFEPSDAILSTAKFLSQSGWPKDTQSKLHSRHAASSRSLLAKQKEAILQYNRSDAYVDTILAMSSQLHKEIAETNIDGMPPEHLELQSTKVKSQGVKISSSNRKKTPQSTQKSSHNSHAPHAKSAVLKSSQTHSKAK